MKKNIYRLPSLLLLSGVLLFSSCKKDDEVSTDQLENEAIQNYSDIVLASYDDTYNTAVTLKQKIDAFVASPSAAGLEECKTAWKAARIPYGQTEAYRFYGGPIDDDNGLEGLINSWPLDEAYIDYVQNSENAGIINKTEDFPTITKELIKNNNQTESETSVSSGYHAIEFLLWGQDLSTTTAGTRPYTDYVTVNGGTAANQSRRADYLKFAAELLVDNLGQVRDQWKSGATYRIAFLKTADAKKILGKVFTGLGELSKGELAGERMLVAVETQDQEFEQSCFSDNTHIDIQMDFKGLQNVYLGTYTRLDGTVVKGRSFSEIAQSVNKTKADAVTAAFKDAETKIFLIPTPFDQAILNDSDKIQAAAASISTLSDKLADVALALGAEY